MNLDCEVDNDARTCAACGWKAPARHVRRNCPKKKQPPGPCAHLGAEVRQQECDSCAGKTQIKVFACAVHGECTLGKKLDGLACCAGCKDYQPKETP